MRERIFEPLEMHARGACICWRMTGLEAGEETVKRSHVRGGAEVDLEFLRGCVRYRQSLDEQLPDAPRSHEELRQE